MLRAALVVTLSAGAGCFQASPQTEAVVAEQPLVMLLVDSSGSMERRSNCPCRTVGCAECMPDCARRERSRWVELLEALGGTFDDYACEALERTEENGATFDLEYFIPHFAPSGVQGDDGVLDVFRDRVRFGFATFDSSDTYLGAPQVVLRSEFDSFKSGGWEGSWSYNPESELAEVPDAPDVSRVGVVRVPGAAEDYYIDGGIRSARADQGALLAATEPARATEINELIQAGLATTRPYGGTPIASSLDDLYYVMRHDPSMALERERPAAKYVVLLTDGYPNPDFRELDCDCAQAVAPNPGAPSPCRGDPSDPRYNPALMHCPYPTAPDAAQALRCGQAAACDGPVERVYVIGFALDDADDVVPGVLERIARAGGGESARYANDSAELHEQLAAILAEIE